MTTDTGQSFSKGGARQRRSGGAGKPRRGDSVAVRVLGTLIVLFSLVLVGAGVSDAGSVDGVPGTITIDRCQDTGRRAVTIECTGTFVSEDGEHRYRVDDFGPDEAYDKGETVDAIAESDSYFTAGAAVQYTGAVKSLCIGFALFGFGLFMVVNGARWRSGAFARWFAVACFGAFGLGMLGVGVCAVLESVLA